MNTTNAIAVGLLLSSFALLGTWAGTVGELRTQNSVGIVALGSESCPYEDQSGGMGGQSGKCTFVCGPGQISLTVSADDNDALVSGSGNCGTGSLHCADTGSCQAVDTTTAKGDGVCSGDSDEFWDSGLYVSCSGSSGGSGGIQIPPRLCPTMLNDENGIRLCGPPSDEESYGHHGAGLALRACQILQLRNQTPLCAAGLAPADVLNETLGMANDVVHKFNAANFTVSAHLVYRHGYVTGLVCWGFDCKQVLPTCAPLAEGRNVLRCSVR